MVRAPKWWVTVLLVLAGVVAYTVAVPVMPITMPERVPAEFQDMLPTEVVEFYNGLTEEDKNVVKEMAQNHAKYQTEEEAMNDLKTKSPKLHEKAQMLRNMLDEKMKACEGPAKEFIEKIIAGLKELRPKGEEKPNLSAIRTKANEMITAYQNLPQEAKDKLAEQFPKITGVLKNEKFQKLAQGLLKTDAPTTPAAAAAPAAAA